MESHPAVSKAAVSDFVTIFVAIELSRKNWLVAATSSDTEKISLHRLAPGDGAGLLDLIGRLKRRIERRNPGPVRVVWCYEAGYDGFRLHRLPADAGVENRVIDAASLQVDRRGRRAKTDRLDVEGLLRALPAHERGERHVFRAVRVPSVEDEDARHPVRERKRPVGERTGHVTRIKALPAPQGIYDYSPLSRNAEACLAGLATGDGRALSPGLLREPERELERLSMVSRMLKEVEAERDRVVASEASDRSVESKIQRLVKLRGIGPESATVPAREFFYRHFDNRRQVGAYAGLTPSPYAGGAVCRNQGISKAGNALVRTTMVELAWFRLRHTSRTARSVNGSSCAWARLAGG